MKPLLILTTLLFAGCAYNGPKIALNVGFMGATVGVSVGDDAPQAVQLPPTKGLVK